jgi:hypothetical protein
MLMNDKELAALLSSQEARIENRDAFFTNLDRTTQTNDEYSLKAEVLKGAIKIAVVHAHVEGQNNVITKAHLKSDHNGAKLFDLSPTSSYAAIILGYAFGPGYRVALR